VPALDELGSWVLGVLGACWAETVATIAQASAMLDAVANTRFIVTSPSTRFPAYGGADNQPATVITAPLIARRTPSCLSRARLFRYRGLEALLQKGS
jgi:hypothetical protein